MRDHSVPFDADRLTWASMLGRWIEFARSAVALPSEGQAGLVRESAPDLIMLQAVWFALEHLSDLADDQRALGLDRAQVLIDRHSQAIRQRFSQTQLPAQIEQLIDEAYAQLARRA